MIASVRGAFSASTKLCASVVTSIPEPLPSLLIIPALALAALAVLEELEVLVLLDEVVELASEVVEDDTEVTMTLIDLMCYRLQVAKL